VNRSHILWIIVSVGLFSWGGALYNFLKYCALKKVLCSKEIKNGEALRKIALENENLRKRLNLVGIQYLIDILSLVFIVICLPIFYATKAYFDDRSLSLINEKWYKILCSWH